MIQSIKQLTGSMPSAAQHPSIKEEKRFERKRKGFNRLKQRLGLGSDSARLPEVLLPPHSYHPC
jgi:hypothetical protein